MDHPPGTVLLPCHDLARYHQFTSDMVLLDVPDGTKISVQRSCSVVQNLNLGVEEFLNDEDSMWLWLIGDDHAFPRDLLGKLLDRDLDIVVPLCTKRGPPFQLVCYPDVIGTDVHGRTLYDTTEFEDLPHDGEPFQVAAAGSAGMLIRRRVLEVMEPPWFRNSDGITSNEDVEFCKAARHAGFPIWVDPEAVIGHIGQLIAYPARIDDVWGVTLELGGGVNRVFIPGGIKLDEKGKDARVGELTPAA